jgi:hypothetical protein
VAIGRIYARSFRRAITLTGAWDSKLDVVMTGA